MVLFVFFFIPLLFTFAFLLDSSFFFFLHFIWLLAAIYVLMDLQFGEHLFQRGAWLLKRGCPVVPTKGQRVCSLVRSLPGTCFGVIA
jgi:hypothetical protein